jgi:hypothetical protein
MVIISAAETSGKERGGIRTSEEYHAKSISKTTN